MQFSPILKKLPAVLLVIALLALALWVKGWWQREQILKQVIDRLSADTRIADVVVTKSELDEKTGKIRTTIKFLEYAADNRPLPPKYFTFQGNVIQFQSLVIRFNDDLIKKGDKLRGKSAYLFLKAFMLDGPNTQEFEITPAQGVPEGYRLGTTASDYEQTLWTRFWQYALDPARREQAGIKNAQIEAPGSLFLPGTIYSLQIEHDGGIRIEAEPVPEILRGEKIA